MKLQPIYLLIVTTLICSCSQEAKPDDNPNTSQEVVEEEVEKVEKEEKPNLYIPKSGDNIFISTIKLLEETNEFAIDLALREGIDWHAWQSSYESKPNSLVFDDGVECTRHRIDNQRMEQFFNTDGLKDVKFYSADNEYLGEAIFVRYENIELPVRSLTAAVYKMNKTPKANPKYAVAGLKESLPHISVKEIDRKDLHEIAKSQSFEGKYESGGKKQLSFGEYIYTYVEGYSTQEFSSVSGLYETKKEKTKNIIDFRDYELIYEIQPVPIEYNGRPVLLLEMGTDGTCAYSTNIYIRQRGKYAPPKSWQRISL